MKVIIPASGTGERFKKAGYKDVKPLIDVTEHTKIIDYVIDMFDKENDSFYVISSPETFDDMEMYLNTMSIDFTHIVYTGAKLGPVGAVIGAQSELEKHITDHDHVIVSYCDYGAKWDYKGFKDFVNDVNPDGAIPCYTGWHPHLDLEENVYAACKVLDNSDIVYEVKEKYKSKNRYDELWSAGLYYFKSYEIMKNAFAETVKAKDLLNGEYYVSLVYNHMPNAQIRTYPIDKFYQFGTPRDFEYAKEKLNSADNLKNEKSKIQNVVVLSAGKGERFLNLGYNQPKPFLPLGKTNLITNIKNTFNSVKTEISFIGSEEHKLFWESGNFEVNYVTPNKIGAAYSYKEGCKNIQGETLIVPCDLIAKHITDEFNELKKTSDVIIFTTDETEYSRNNPNSFAWVLGDNNIIEDIGIKEKLETSRDQMLLIGSFWVRENSFLLENINEIFEKELKVNNEYYLDSAFKNMLGKIKVNYIKIDKYFSFGTPEEYKESKYWLDGVFDE